MTPLWLGLLFIIKEPKNFDNFIGHGLKHFNLERDILIWEKSNCIGCSNEILKIFHNQFRGVKIIDENQTILKKHLPGSNNILIFDYPNKKDLNLIDSDDNVIIYITKREKCEKIHKLYYSHTEKWILFRMIMFCDLKEDYGIWIQEQWQDPGWRKIQDIRFAYFNRRPNFHGWTITVMKDFYGVDKIMRSEQVYIEHLEEFWNTTHSREGDVLRLWIFPNPLTYINEKISYRAYSMISLCVVVHKEDHFPPWQALPRAFHLYVWIFLTLTWISSSIIWHFVSKDCFLNSSIRMLCLFSTYSITWLGRIKTIHSRIISISIMLISIVVINGLQSVLYTNLKEPGSYPPPNTLEDLAEREIELLCDQGNCVNISDANVGKRVMQKFRDGFRPISNSFMLPNKPFSLQDVSENSSLAIFYPCESARVNIEKIQKYSETLHLVKETLTTTPLLFGTISNNFPNMEKIRKMLISYEENGIARWRHHLYEWKEFLPILMKDRQKATLKIFSMEDLQIAFIILLIGEMIAILVFLLEILQIF